MFTGSEDSTIKARIFHIIAFGRSFSKFVHVQAVRHVQLIPVYVQDSRYDCQMPASQSRSSALDDASINERNHAIPILYTDGLRRSVTNLLQRLSS